MKWVALKCAVAAVAVLATFSAPALAVNEIITEWNFEFPPANLDDSATGPSVSADIGTGTLTGVHASALSDWSTPAGNGTFESLSVNNWAVNDYWEFTTSTTGKTGIGIEFDQISSTTGPRDFKIQYSANGNPYADLVGGAYQVQPNATPSWSSLGPVFPLGLDTYRFDFSSIAEVNNATSVSFRLTVASNLSASDSATGGIIAATGTNRIDNVRVLENFAASTPPAAPQLPIAGDIVFGLNSNRELTTVELVRGAAAMNGGTKTSPYSAWTNRQFVQGIKFDNLGGNLHNVNGNLLGVDTGTIASGGGKVYNFATQGTAPFAADQVIATSGGGSGVTLTRFTGLSVSPNNDRIALAGMDTGRVVVYDYTAGNTMGGGASTSGGRESAANLIALSGQGTTWLDNDTVLSFATDGKLYSTDASTPAMTTAQVGATITVPNNNTESTALAYNPDVSPYVFALWGGFTAAVTMPVPMPAVTNNFIYVIDPNSSFAVVDTINLSGNTQTIRDLALDADGNLFVSRNTAIISVILDAAANVGSIADDSDVLYYQSEVFGSGFNGFDIGFEPDASGLQGDFNGDGFVDAVDYTVWRNNLGDADETNINNNGDGMNGVDAGDYTLWKSQYGEGTPPGAGAGGIAPVPEPTSALLLLVGLIGAVACGRRK